MHVRASVTIGLRDGIFIGGERTVLQSRSVFKAKVVAVVVLFSVHSLLLECTHSHIYFETIIRYCCLNVALSFFYAHG